MFWWVVAMKEINRQCVNGGLGQGIELGQEILQDERNLIPHCNKRHVHVPTYENLASAKERWLSKNEALRLTFRARDMGDSPDFLAIYQKHASGGIELGHAITIEDNLRGNPQSGDLDQSVFVGVVEFVEQPEGRRVNVPAVIRLERLNPLTVVGPNSADLVIPVAMESAPVAVHVNVEDRERKLEVLFGSGGVGVPVVEADKLPHETIESGSKIVRDVTDDRADAKGDLLFYRRAKDVVLTTRIEFVGDDLILVRLPESNQFGIEIVNVQLCATKLLQRPGQWMHWLKSSHGTNTENPEGQVRDTDTQAQGRVSGLAQDSKSETAQEVIQPHEEVASGTSIADRSDGYNAKHTRLDRTGDA